MFSNLCDKFDMLGTNLTEKIGSVDSRMSELQDIVIDLREYKSQVNGALRLAMFMGGGLITIILGVSWFALNSMLDNMEHRIMQKHADSIASVKEDITKYVDSMYESKDVTINRND